MSPAIDVLGRTLVHFVWQGSLIGVLTATVLTAMTRRSAQARYLVACLAMIAMLVAPAATAARLAIASSETSNNAETATAFFATPRTRPAIEASRTTPGAGSQTSAANSRRVDPLVL